MYELHVDWTADDSSFINVLMSANSFTILYDKVILLIIQIQFVVGPLFVVSLRRRPHSMRLCSVQLTLQLQSCMLPGRTMRLWSKRVLCVVILTSSLINEANMDIRHRLGAVSGDSFDPYAFLASPMSDYRRHPENRKYIT